MIAAGLAGLLAGSAALLIGRPPVRLPVAPRPIRDPGRWRRRPRRRGGSPESGDADLADLADRLAALGRAGVPEADGWRLLSAASGPGSAECARVDAMLRAGGTAPEGLRRAATEPGAMPGLTGLALALDVVHRSGAASAAPLKEFAAAIRADAEARDERVAALAGPRATAQLLAVLPLGGLLLGWAIGADPVRVLLATAPGRGCLLVGAALWAAGRAWTVRLVEGAARAGR